MQSNMSKTSAIDERKVIMKYILEFDNVVKQFPNSSYLALDHINLKIEEGELVTILGTSGCGKTTLIKLINRLYEAEEGKIILKGQNIKDFNPIKLRQNIGYVIQQIGLFPHMSVYNNIATVPKIKKWPKEKIDVRVDELLNLVNLAPEEFKNRYPVQLSGGQQQRIGLIRALAADPEIMLLDEPFGAIDAINRSALQDELLKIHQKSHKTFLFVTHDINEAFKLGTKVLIMNKGKVEQYASPKDIQNNPANDFVRSLIQASQFGFESGDGI